MMMAVVMEHERMDQQDANSYQIPPVSSRIEQFPFVIYYSGGRNCNLSNIWLVSSSALPFHPEFFGPFVRSEE